MNKEAETAKKTESANAKIARAIREEAAGYRVIASKLLTAELAGEWKLVADARAMLVEAAMVLEEVAERTASHG